MLPAPKHASHGIVPSPPIVSDELLHVGNGLRLLDNPGQFLAEARSEYGDTFLVDVFGYQLLCTFAPKGLECLYQLPEEDASFGLATYDLVGFKTPAEVFIDTDAQLFYQLLTVKRVNGYLPDMEALCDLEIERLGDRGEFEVFDRIRTLEQRMGYRLWIGTDASSDAWWKRLKQQFDVLDQERAFVDPAAILETIKSNKARERAAVIEIRHLIDQIWSARADGAQQHDDTLTFLHQKFSGEADPSIRHRKVAHNVINANQGFLSNLYAAISWCLIHTISQPAYLSRAREEIAQQRAKYGSELYRNAQALSEMVYLEQLLMESVRVAQRSITLRKVVNPVTLDDGAQQYRVPPGVYITTLLTVTNLQTSELSRFDPEHYVKNRLSSQLNLPGKETVSTFGHGKHACPAQRFSHMMNKIVLGKLLETFNFTPLFDDAQPSSVQLGGVARSAEPCPLAYRKLKP